MDPEYRTADTMRERAGQSNVKIWLFVEANRLLIVGALATVVFVTLVAVGALYPDAVAVIRSGASIDYTFQAFVGAVITGVTLVVTLNQLVLSQEFGQVGDQRERMEQTMDFRRRTEDAINAPVSPPEPTAFVRALVEATRNRAIALRETTDSGASPELREKIETLTGSIESNADEVSDQIEDASFGRYSFLSAALDFNYSWKLFSVRRISGEHADELTDEQAEALEKLATLLELFGPAREHFKTLHIRSELVKLSRVILASSIPALLVALGMLYYFDPARITGAVLGVSTLVLAVSAAATVAVLPFLILIAYVFRLATVVQLTLAIGPFTLGENKTREPIDWE